MIVIDSMMIMSQMGRTMECVCLQRQIRLYESNEKKVISNKAHCVFYVHVQIVKNPILIRALYLSLKHVNKVNATQKIVMT